MCDTLYAGPGACAGGSSWFAKNSDRNPDEPQALCLVGRRPPTAETLVGGRSLPLPDRGYSFLLSKPSWMAGGEMGVNERGVAIGNEAVFSRFPAAKDGVLGMDILRAALVSSGSAAEARDAICDLTERVDQGGNGAYKGTLRYCNSYLASDPAEAFVVETAGHRWAWRKIEGIASISNAYSIGTDYKRLDAQTRKEIAPVNPELSCADATDAGRCGVRGSWRAHVEDSLRLRFTKGDARRATVEGALEASLGGIDLATILAALRSHGAFDPARPRGKHMTSVCMHAGGLLNNATTASIALAYRPASERGPGAVVWFTGTSYPCLSVYKPILLVGGEFVPLWTEYDYREDATGGYGHWERQRAWIAREKAGALGRDHDFVARRDSMQDRIEAAAAAAIDGGSLEEARRAVDAAIRDWYGGLKGRS